MELLNECVFSVLRAISTIKTANPWGVGREATFQINACIDLKTSDSTPFNAFRRDFQTSVNAGLETLQALV